MSAAPRVRGLRYCKQPGWPLRFENPVPAVKAAFDQSICSFHCVRFLSVTAWWKTLGSPVLTPEVQKKLIDSVHAEVGSRTIDELAAKRDEVLLGLLELRAKAEKEPAARSAVARAG